HMRSRSVQEGNYSQEPADRRSARRLTVRVTNKARFNALVFDENGQELKEIPGNGWSAVPEFSNGSWAVLDIQGVWCEADISRNGDNVDILPRRTCTKVQIQ
ncbi:MAG: hypothetical protein L0312_15930, partial [Acidobacteria bacterium]|nr:hypothetical protein [Acidobacteriota bacterium]